MKANEMRQFGQKDAKDTASRVCVGGGAINPSSVKS